MPAPAASHRRVVLAAAVAVLAALAISILAALARPGGPAPASGAGLQAGAIATEAAAAPEGMMSLDVNQARFWRGGMIENANVTNADACGVEGPCPEWKLELAPGASRLRVALDTPSREDGFQIDLIDPAGKVAASENGSNVFASEAFAKDPKAGTWTVRVLPKNATQAFFRLRAKLEGAPAPKGVKRMLLPNLKAVPPYEFGFAAPANPGNAAYPPDTVNPSTSAGGQEPVSCAADESAPASAGGADAKVCLRLTAGPINTGEGPFVKTFAFSEDLAAGKAPPPMLRGAAKQRIAMSDGTNVTRDAGTYSFHTTHAHFHDDSILTYELFSVDGPEGTELKPAGKGTKSGFCPADQLIGEWRRFTQDPSGTFGEGDTATGNCYGAQNGAFTLTRGWGDVYRYQRPGQYVEFAGNGDGYYVVRTTVDITNTTLELSEDDNSAYALIRVSGKRIEMVERGQGKSHVDPAKEVFTGFGPASQDGFGGELPKGGQADGPGQLVTATGPGTGGDRTAPKVSRVKLLKRGRVRIALSEPATVKLTLKRGSRTLRRVSVRARRGVNVIAFGRRAVRRRGAYRLGITARDSAGNFSKATSRRLVRR